MKNWLKVFGVVLLIYVHLAGMLLAVPELTSLNETIRALYFHVPIWFGMVLLYLVSVYYSVKYLVNPAGISLLVYFAYFVLRGSSEN